MHLDRVLTSNWMNLRHGDFALAPLTLVAGDHGMGKSALRDAIRFALTGECSRIDAKSERADLISTGASKGAVTLFAGPWVVARNIKDGKAKTEGENPLPEADRDLFRDVLPFVVEPERFALADVSTRRGVLMAAMKTPITAAKVKQLMAERGVPAEALAVLKDDADLAAWYRIADTAASEARGAWRAITGETYGEVKAEGWAPTGVPENPTDERIAELKHAEETATAAIATAERVAAAAAAAVDVQIGVLDTARATVDGHPAKIQERQAAHAAATTTQLEAAERVTQLRRRLPKPPHSCPHCQGLLSVDAKGVPVVYVKPAKPATQAEVDEAEAARVAASAEMGRLTGEITVLQTELRQAEAQVAKLGAVEVDEDGPGLAAANAAVDAARKAQGAAMDRYRRGLADRNAAEAARSQVERAAAEHARVKLWSQIRDHVDINGIPGELLGKALKPFNDTLRTFAEETGWPQVTIGQDMSIMVGEYRYRQRSASEKWRADAMIAIALSGHSGLGFVLLDEADILNAEERANLLSWLMELNGGGLDTAVVFATLNKRPTEMPEGCILHWLTPAEEGRAAA
jgi:hypothetical protein